MIEPVRLEAERLQADERRQRREGADGQNVAVRELDDVEHAEKQREADGDKRIHHAEHQPVHDVLGEQPRVHGSGSRQRQQTAAGPARRSADTYF